MLVFVERNKSQIKDKVMYSRFQDLVLVHLKDEGDPELDRPSEDLRWPAPAIYCSGGSLF